MVLLITDQCINCDMCLPECPNEAIYEGEKVYEIDVARCTECVGFYDYQTCVSVCPIECIIPHPEHVETKEQLQEKFNQLNLFGQNNKAN
ncbi:YfhL family 4Fe-4S dicluster ferredoxin [Acinetobacter towneri]|uniref:YfhL family 4Fe-4S dicluster ferredoxin n=1 Tax=Acinetobacter towneri TaxID=202956 RepID=UPI0034D5D9F3